MICEQASIKVDIAIDNGGQGEFPLDFRSCRRAEPGGKLLVEQDANQSLGPRLSVVDREKQAVDFVGD